MTLGNLAALRQENIKRLLAYSSIAHAGYVLIGVVAAGLGVGGAQASVLFYLVAYTFTTLGAFGVVAWIGNRKDERLFVDDWAGLAAARPAVALAMTIFLLSLGGVPPTGGFFAKFYLFRAAMETPAALLAGRDRRAQQRGQRLLLPAHRRRDVLPRCLAPAGADRFGVDERGPDHHRDRRRAAGGLPRHVVDWAGPAVGTAGTAVTALLGK